MARTTARTQMIVGLLLKSCAVNVENIDELDRGTVSHRSLEQLAADPEYQQAEQIVTNILHRAIIKNANRQDAAYGFGTDLDAIDEHTGYTAPATTEE